MLLLFSLPKHNSSCQLPSELPPDLLSTRIIWVWPNGMVPPLHPSMTALHRPLPGTPHLHHPGQAERGHHRRELPQGLDGHGRHAWQPQMPWQTAGPRRDGHSTRCLPRESSCFKAGLVFRPAGFFTIAAGAAENPPGNCFSPTLWGGFCMPCTGSSSAASTKAVPTGPAETACKD
jgi:hypothetical protein